MGSWLFGGDEGGDVAGDESGNLEKGGSAPLMGRERQRDVWGEGGSGVLTHPLTEPICLRLITPKCCWHSGLQAVPSNRTAPKPSAAAATAASYE